MRILIVSQYFWPETFRINDMALALTKAGYEVNVLTGMPNYPHGKFLAGYRKPWPKKEIYEGITIFRVPLIARGNASNWRLCLNYFSFMFFACLFAPFLCRDKYDIIFCFQPSPVTVGIPAVWLKKIKKAPLFFWIQDSWPETLTAVGRVKSLKLINLFKKIVAWIYKNCDKILVPAKSIIPIVQSYDIKLEKIHYFPNWAETFYQPIDSPNVKLPSGFTLLFAGNHGDAQALESVIQAALLVKQQGYSDIQWIFLGDGHRKALLQAKVAALQLQDNIHFINTKPVTQMPDYFAAVDALLITLADDPIFSLTIPSKLQSYLACKKPIIAAIQGETAEIIREANAGMVCSPEQPRALADTVIHLYHLDNQHKQIMGENAYRYYHQHFSREHLLAELMTQFRRAAL